MELLGFWCAAVLLALIIVKCLVSIVADEASEAMFTLTMLAAAIAGMLSIGRALWRLS